MWLESGGERAKEEVVEFTGADHLDPIRQWQRVRNLFIFRNIFGFYSVTGRHWKVLNRGIT